MTASPSRLCACVLGLWAGLALAQQPAATPAAPAAREAFYRTPALHGQTIVFTAEGDLWRVPASGGRAERITTHPDLESRPALSPDGRWLAFSAAYERAGEAYVMPLDGGLPQRLSWDGQNPRVWGWTPAGEVLVTAPSVRGEPVSQLFAIHPQTQVRRSLPVGQASDGAVSADGGTLYFTRQGLTSDNVRAYRGGAMARLWRLDLNGRAEAQPLLAAAARAEANEQRPMPTSTPQGARLAFLSDRDGRVNLWSVDSRGADLRQHTRHRDADIRHASAQGGRVVYALGADLRLVDLASGEDRLVPITLGGDADLQRTRWVPRPQQFFGHAALAPDGQRVALSLRGSVVTQGTGLLRRAQLPVPPDARCRDAVFSHDSQHVFALCDIAAPGTPAAGRGAAPPELEIWRFRADGSGSPQQLTRGADIRRLGIFPSPDGQWLAHTDKAGRLHLSALGDKGAGPARRIDTPGPHARTPQQLAWSADGQALAWVQADSEPYRQRLYLHHVALARTVALTSNRYDSDSPAFTPDGRWLYFLSDRSFVSLNTSPWGDRNLGPYFDRRTQVYALALQAGTTFPFDPPDELRAAEAEVPAAPAAAASSGASSSASAGASAGTPATATATTPAPPRAGAVGRLAAARPAIQLDGLAARLHEVPLPAGNFTRLRSDGRRLYLLEPDASPERRGQLRSLAIDNLGAPPELFAADVNQFELTPDGKRLLLLRRAANGPQPGDIQLLDAAAKAPAEAAVLARSQVRWSDGLLATDPAAEWRQIFDDAWRLHRDHFYDARMHGADWPALRRKYAALLPRVADRRDLNELLAQMVGELGALHSQVGAADLPRGADDIGAAGLGARLVRTAQGFLVEHVYRSDLELPGERSPLAKAGVQAGELITACNGRPLAAGPGPALHDLGELLRGQAGRQVLLSVQAAGPAGAERRVVVVPVTAQRQQQLRTGDWEQGRLAHATQHSQGRVGYLRLRAMGSSDIATFAREFYAQLDREALVIDVRGNGGGNIDSWVLEKLLRRAWGWWQSRSPAGVAPYSNMQQAFRGHLAVLIDEQTYSDGETFAEGFRRLGLGVLVGRRTSGAGVWLSDNNRLQDGGLMRAAEEGQFTAENGWLIEGRGVTPDIEVDNPPRATHEGGDAQLDAAVEHLLRRLAEQPLREPVPPPYPSPAARR